MASHIQITPLEIEKNSWFDKVDNLRKLLGAPNNVYLFPPHFLKATFPKIGGQVVVFEKEQRAIGVGFLFPRTFQLGSHGFTLRFHRVDQNLEIDQEQAIIKVKELLGGDKVVFYDPLTERQYTKTIQKVEGTDIGRPDAEEASEIWSLQQKIWSAEQDFVYPADIHSSDFRTGTSLVARLNGEPVGFCFGFYKFGGSQLPATWNQKCQSNFRLESQLLGVLQKHRHRGIAFTLKKVQARNAQREQIDIVNWTVDPLQFGNAILNFGRLKAIAFDYYPNYYALKNELNQVATSRFGITWLVSTQRVQQALSSLSEATIQDLNEDSAIPRINHGSTESHLEEDAQVVAIEVPSNWTALQNKDLEQALIWRETTDRIFQQYLGCDEGKYIVTGVGQDGERKYLIAEKVDLALLKHLAM